MFSAGLAGGSFMALKNFAEVAYKEYDITIIGLGTKPMHSEKYEIIGIPYPRYDGVFGHITAKYQLLNLIFQLPLYIIGFLMLLKDRPRVVFFNGLATMIPLLPFAKLVQAKVVLSFRSWWDQDRFGKIKPLIDWYGKHTDIAYVNSIGTKENLSQIIPSDRIVVVSHHANPLFFETRDRDQIRKNLGLSKQFVFLYVGRMDEEKHIPLWLDVIKSFEKDSSLKFLFIGNGRLVQSITALEKKNSQIQYLGFMNKPSKLSQYYTAADILFTNADETYLSRPAIEALSCSTPIMVPSIPAVGEKISKGMTIPDTLFPQTVGWLLKQNTKDAVHKLIVDIIKNDEATKKRSTCLQYAQKEYKKDPNELLLEALLRV